MGRATHAEVASAIEALARQPGDMVRLREFAKNRIARIGPWAANGRTAEELLQIATLKVLEGSRTWNPEKVDLKGLLMGAMWSIASSWAAHHGRNHQSPEYALSESGADASASDGNGRPAFDNLASQAPSPEDELIRMEEARERNEIADQIGEACAGDEDALAVIAGLEDGMSLVEIRDEFGWEDNTIRAVMRRIKRRTERVLEGRGDHHAVR